MIRVGQAYRDKEQAGERQEKGGRKMTDKSKFPQTLNVTVENEGEGEDEYLDLNGSLNDKAETGKERLVAVYELKKLVTVKTNIVSEPYKGK